MFCCNQTDGTARFSLETSPQKMFFAIYIHDSYVKVHPAYNADYKSIEEYYFVKEISEEEKNKITNKE